VAIEDEILAALDPDQRAVALATRGPVCVIAGAGTGKTRAITHRIAYAAAIGTMDPQKVLALTFTAKAAGEMRARLRSLGVPTVAARTIHAAALKQLTFFWPQVFGGRTPDLLTTKSGFLTEAIKREIRCVRIVHGKGLGSVNKEPVLKNKVMRWLVQREEVLAFCQARPNDGGSGALIVLLIAARTQKKA